MKYLITGGCGFIGVNFAENLIKKGEEVVILDNLSRKGTTQNLNYLIKNYSSIKFVHADIRNDQEKLNSIMNEVDFVFHLAGQVAVTTSVKNPREDFDINALGTFNILEAIRQSAKKPGLIYASTNKVYGGMTDIKIVKKENRYVYENLPNGIPENRLLDFHSPYGCSKGTADQYVRDYSRIFDLKTVVMRQSCIYGQRQFGIEDQGWVAWFTIASHLERPITIYGDGMQVRDVLYVDDLFDAWYSASKNIDNISGEIFNVGGGPAYTMSLLELLGILEEISQKKIPVSYSDWRPGDQPVYISDISHIKNKLNWEPKVTPKDGVAKLFAWVKENESNIKEIL
jgi:CDP-paratose 2-epimerase